MATSGTNTFDLDIEEIIEEAYEKVGLEATSGYDLKSARRCLNLMFSDLANRGINLWTVALRTKTLVDGTSSYSLDGDLIDVLSAVVTDAGDSQDYQLERISRAEYLHIPKKSSEARSNQFYLHRAEVSGGTPTLYLYPTPDAADTFKYWALTYIQDAGDYTNQAEVPQRFLPALTSGLAYYIAIKKSPERVQLLKMVYDEEMARALLEDRDRAPLRLVPNVGV